MGNRSIMFSNKNQISFNTNLNSWYVRRLMDYFLSTFSKKRVALYLPTIITILIHSFFFALQSKTSIYERTTGVLLVRIR